MHVTFIGGPADLERRIVDKGCRIWRVPEIPQCLSYVSPVASPEEAVEMKVHTYHIQQVGYHTWIALHDSLAGR